MTGPFCLVPNNTVLVLVVPTRVTHLTRTSRVAAIVEVSRWAPRARTTFITPRKRLRRWRAREITDLVPMIVKLTDQSSGISKHSHMGGGGLIAT